MGNETVLVDEQHLRQLRGRPVCVVMKDGARHFGLLTGCSRGKVVLNGSMNEQSPDARRASNGRAAAKRPQRAGGKSARIAAGADAGLPLPPADGWGTLSLEPPLPLGSKVVLPLAPIRAVIPL